jgi:putative ABC transport system substrate-binding protein
MRRIWLVVVLMTGSLLVALVAEAQQAKIASIGFLSAGVASLGRMAHVNQALRDGLSESGYVENQSVTIEYRWAEENEERLPVLAAELVKHRVDVIIAAGPSAIRAAKSVTSTLPVVGIDLIRWRLDLPLASPGRAAASRASFSTNQASVANGCSY